ncbi:unnamed protein product [Paramecium primaurelia]|uniref:Uncharacterized protein n=1 Tax=Paramecium primaurelia TaxID=5886 RepID=A0A8S1N8K5_PARPR|nr:unnamed protein product [Paramecium primaurelia]
MASKSQPPIQEKTFHEWSKNNFYRTSYINHYTQLPQEPKNSAVPGYAGYVPYVQSENLYGERFSEVARKSFADSKLGKFNRLSSTGFNFDAKELIDPHKEAYSHKYGCQTILKHHPCTHIDKMVTSYQDGFKKPQNLVAPTFRKTDRYLETSQAQTKTSGFQKNHMQFDGSGWIPHENMNGDQIRTEYRIQYNQEKPFHRNPIQFKLRKMKQTEMNYKHT